jgi:hypothetical protein
LVADADEDEGVWGIDSEVSLRREGGDDGEVSCSPLSVLGLVTIELREDEAEDALWTWWTTRGGSSWRVGW